MRAYLWHETKRQWRNRDARVFRLGPHSAVTCGWLRQPRVTPLPSSAAVAAKIAVAMSFALPSIALVVGAASVIPGTELGVGQAIELVGLMWIATTPLTALATLIVRHHPGRPVGRHRQRATSLRPGRDDRMDSRRRRTGRARMAPCGHTLSA